MATYDSILQTMKDKYEEYAGEEVADTSDVGIRMKVLADEVFSLLSYADWLKRQMFFTTATGESLDLHAQERGLSRIEAKKATGRLAFSLSSTLEYDLIIPEGTICSTSDGTLRYVTTEEGTIEAGSLIVQVSAEAEEGGSEYNVVSGSVDTVVTYFSVSINVKSTSSFSGGEDKESDDELRARLIEFCKYPSNGLNKTYYENLILENVDEVKSISVRATDDDTYNMIIIVAGEGEKCSSDTVEEVSDLLEENAPAHTRILVESCSLLYITIGVNVTAEAGYDADTVQASVEDSIYEYFNSLGVGDDVILAALGDVIFHTDGVANYEFTDDITDATVDYAMLAVCTTLTVTVTEAEE